MPKRLRLYDVRMSRLPTLLGLCVGDVTGIANYVNTAQRRLLYAKEASDESWYGTWAEVVLRVSRQAPYITLPREIARIEAVNVCDRPILLNNQFVEYLQFGNGRMPKQCLSRRGCGVPEAYTRNNAVLFTDLTNSPQNIRVYATNASDIAGTSRIMIQGLDAGGNQIYTQDTLNQVNGQFLVLQSPFVQAPQTFSYISGIQKDVTQGQVQIFQVDPTTGEQILLLTMEPSETVSGYRRYYFDALPCGCRPPATTPQNCPELQATAIAKLELIPVVSDTDYLLFHNLEAITEECQSIRYSEMDTQSAKAMSSERHIQAIRLLNGELSHYEGKNNAAVNFKPFGSARLERIAIGMI